VQHGTPEILFIKRATRKGDKWTGHVALPGGKRDPEDDSDAVTAVREALEEVGIDLSYTHALAAGNLPQRVVTTSWGKVPLMVLCPYVYLLTSPEYPAQRLQPDEVASSHWVPLKALLSPELRTYEYADVSARLAKSELGIKKWFLQAMLSKMMFAAIHLIPSNSTYCPTIPGFIPPTSSSGSPPSSSANLPFFLTNPESSATQAAKHPPPLLLWGLTLGVVSDFLEHIPPHNALELWTYPTFTSPDVRLWMWALSYRFRKRKAAEMSSAALANSLPPSRDEGAETFKAGEAGEGSIAVHPEPLLSNPELPVAPEKPGEVGIAGLGCGRHWGRRARNKMIARGAAVNGMLEGYYPIVRKAVAVALICRVLMVGGLGWWTWRRGVWQGIGRALGGLGIVWRSGVVV
jgi:8-oxo-dGTP pyrophosphatase MutT (NUDIX family)